MKHGREGRRKINMQKSTMQKYCYPASSWFLLRQMREKPLRTTVCFFIEHTRVPHAPRDAFDVNFICVSVQKNANFSPKVLEKERFKPSSKYCKYLVRGLNTKPKFRLSCSLLGRIPELVERNTPNNNSEQCT